MRLAILAPVLIALDATAPGIRAQPRTDAEREAFLREAEIIDRNPITQGSTSSVRLTLRLGDFVHDAHFQTVQEVKHHAATSRAPEFSFRDSYQFNIAAYRLDRLLGLRMTPTSVPRVIENRPGALTWWVDDVAMMEKERWIRDIKPPDLDRWNAQIHRARAFNELVYNTDPNLGNILIDRNWKIWLIDFSRAFPLKGELRRPENLLRIDRPLFARLKALDAREVEATLSDVLRPGEIALVLRRRDALVEFFERKAREEGEERTFVEAPASSDQTP